LSLKVRQAGYALMVDESVFIHHYGSQTFIANKIDYQKSLEERGKRFREKWPEVDYEELLELKGTLTDMINEKRDQAQQYFEKGEMESALSLYREILRDDPMDGGALLGAALCSKNLQKIPDSLKYLQKMVQLYPDNPVAYNELGVLSVQTGDLDGARQYFIRSIETDPTFVDAQRNYADVLIAREDYENGIQALVKILNNHPDDVPTLLYMANLYIETERLQDALLFLKRIKELDPANTTADQLLELVETMEKQRQGVETEPYAMQSGNGNDTYQEDLEQANRLLGSEQTEEAMNIYDTLLQQMPEDPGALYGLGLAKLVTGDTSGAKNAFSRLIIAQPEFAEGHYNLGVLHMQEAETEKAVESFTRTLELAPEHKNAKISLSDLLIQQELFEEGLQLLQNVLKTDPDDIYALTRMGNLCLEADRREDARLYFSKILEIDPQNEWAVSGLNQMDMEG
jgi:tetratricopeptide (TPR) repeat protein